MRTLVTRLVVAAFLLAIATGQAFTQVPRSWLERIAYRAQGFDILLNAGSLTLRDTLTQKVSTHPLGQLDLSAVDRFIAVLADQRRTFTAWTSATTPLVEGGIQHITVDRDGIVWMFGYHGTASRFDGREWTRVVVCTKKHESHPVRECIIDDVLEHNNSLSVIACGSVVEIGRLSGRVQRVIDLPTWTGRGHLESPNRVEYMGGTMTMVIDLAARTVGVHRVQVPPKMKKGFDKRQRFEDSVVQRWHAEHPTFTIHDVPLCVLCGDEHHDPYELTSTCSIDSIRVRPIVRSMLTDPVVVDHERVDMCGVVHVFGMWLDHLAIDRSENVYLATRRGVFIIHNPSTAVSADTPTSISLLAYPNPAVHELTVSVPRERTSVLDLHIVNEQGRLIRTIPVRPDQHDVLIDVRELPVGAYTLVLRMLPMVATGRFLVTR